MHTTKHRRGLVKSLGLLAATAMAAVSLTACSTTTEPINVGTVEKAQAVACDKAHDVAKAVSALAASGAPGERNQLKDWGLDPSNQEQITTVHSALNARADACAKGSGGNTVVGTADGSTVALPWVSGVDVNNGDTRQSVQMPSIHKLLPKCGILKTWATLTACNDSAIFTEAVNRYSPRSSFDWSKVEQWAVAKTVDGKTPEARVIMLTGTMTALTDDQARERVKSLTDGASLSVIRLKQSGFTNTWRTDDGKSIRDFVDYNNEVRVSLAPLVLNAKGQAIGLDADHMFNGVFVDCDNIHWLDIVTPAAPEKPVCPEGSMNAGQPVGDSGYAGCNPPPTTPPTGPPPTNPPPPPPPPSGCPAGQTWNGSTCLEPKQPSQDSGSQGNVPPQVQGSNPPLPGPAAPPAVPEPTTPYTAPPAPPAPTPTPSRETPAPQPTTSTTETAAPPPPAW